MAAMAVEKNRTIKAKKTGANKAKVQENERE